MNLFFRLVRSSGLAFTIFGAAAIGASLEIGSSTGVASDWGVVLFGSCILLAWLLWTEKSRCGSGYLFLLSLIFGLYGFACYFDRVFVSPSSLSGIDFSFLACVEFILLAPVLVRRIWIARKQRRSAENAQLNNEATKNEAVKNA
jgi:hypothetical protein